MVRRLLLELLTYYLRRTPIDNGRWRLIPFALKWVRSASAAGAQRVIRTRHRFRMHVSLGDWGGRHLYATGEYEPATTELIKTILQPGDTFVDVGANIGYFTLLASNLVGVSGRVYAFEPVPATRETLEANTRLNQSANVVIRPEVLADQPGEVTFFVGPDHHRGISSLRRLGQAGGEIRVPRARLDDLLPPGEKISLMKIDVEGAEHLVLAGMRGCLSHHQPDLVIEVTDEFLRQMGSSAEGLCKFLVGLGYRMYAIEHTYLRPIGPGEPFPDQFNALFTVRDRLPTGLSVSARTGAA